MLEGGRLKLLFGGRYDIVHQEQVSDGTVLPDMNDQAFTGRVGALYELTDQFSPYVSVSQSFQPQSPDVIDVDGQALDPEEGLQYEAGIKGSRSEEHTSEPPVTNAHLVCRLLLEQT